MSRIWWLIPAFAVWMIVLVLSEFIKSNPELFFDSLTSLGVVIGVVCVIYYFYNQNSNRVELQKLAMSLESLGGKTPYECELFFHTESEFNKLKSELEIDIVTALVSRGIAKYIKVLERKKSQLIYLDDYGRAITGAWDKECKYFIKNVIYSIDTSSVDGLTQGLSDACAYYLDPSNTSMFDYWAAQIDLLIDSRAGSGNKTAICHSDLLPGRGAGHDYERYVASLILDLGWHAKVTKGSGDHGADIIVEKDGIRIAVQCKYYSSPVGNKSVQEAYSAKEFYDCHHACVVANSSYTPAAKKAAGKLGVSLLHHEDIGDYLGSNLLE